MSKKKNTLKDLDDFLKQQAAMLVAPEKLSGKVAEPVPDQHPIPVDEEAISVNKILHNLRTLSVQEKSSFRKNLYDIIIQSLEAQEQSLSEDKMLINTVLYLKNGNNWKDAIRAYWKNR